MSDTFQTPAVAAVPLELPDIVWIGNHPTIANPERGGTRLRRCIRCNHRDAFHTSRCEPGLTVHLIDPADVHAAPAVFDGNGWAEPEAIEGAHRHWRDQGYRVVRKPDGPTGESVHPRFRACPRCNEEAMAAGTLAPVHLRWPPAPVAAPERARGWVRR